MSDTVTMFWELGLIDRVAILHKLKLLPEKEDRLLNEVKRTKIAFENARKLGLVKKLRRHVLKIHKEYYQTKNN